MNFDPRHLTPDQRTILISLYRVNPTTRADALAILKRTHPDLSNESVEQITSIYATARL